MKLKDEIKENAKNEVILFCENIKRHPLRFLIHILRFLILISISIVILWALIEIPPMGVSHFNINDTTDKATLENQYRATLAQILGGVAIIISLYYTYKRVSVTEKSIIIAREGQITEQFTRAVDQLGAIDNLGNPALEIRLGGIYALERISNESEKDYWPIIEILTAYIRKNSSIEVVEHKKNTYISMDIQANEITKSEIPEIRRISLDIQAVLTVLGRRKKHFNNGEDKRLNLRGTCLQEADLYMAHLEGAHLEGAHLEGARFERAHLEGTHLEGAHLEEVNFNEAHLDGTYLEGAYLIETHLIRAFLFEADLTMADLSMAHLEGAHLEGAYLIGANLGWVHLEWAHLGWANLERANLEGAFLLETNLERANLKGAVNLTVSQLLKVKTLYKAELDDDLEVSLRDKNLNLFEKPN